jgi:hypothetical protein
MITNNTNGFNSFCTRMWLDNEDENLNMAASNNRMTRDEYVERWHDWLKKQYVLKNGIV